VAVGVAVDVAVGVIVGLGVDVAVGVGVIVGVGVDVAVGVTVKVGVGMSQVAVRQALAFCGLSGAKARKEMTPGESLVSGPPG
jgi:hypothetical protein